MSESNKEYRVLIADNMSPLADEVFSKRGIQVERKTGLKPEELAEIIGGFDGVAVRSATKLTEDLIQRAEKLKVVGRAGIGVDNIDVNAASKRGVVVMNTPFGNSTTTAEHTIAMLFAAARRIAAADASTRLGKWEKSKFMGTELTGKTLGLIGCGNIGSIVAERANGLKMRVLAFDPFLTDERARDVGVERVELDQLLGQADFISLHTPLTDDTRKILNKDTLAKTKKGVRVVNCARGGLIDEPALAEAIKSGQVASAAIDVFEEEPARENPLFELDEVVLTPHLGASTEEAQVNVAVQVAEQMADYLVGGVVTNALNMPSVSAEDAPRLKPYMQLADQLGALLGQIYSGPINSIRIEYAGPVASLNVKPLTALALKGLLAKSMESVNVVNAPLVAKSRGIEISESTSDSGREYQTEVRLIVNEGDPQKSGVSAVGTLFSSKPRVVELNRVQLEAELTPHMIYIRNNDRPGQIGAIGAVLGEAGTNIGYFHLGRHPKGGEAVALVSVDEAPSQQVVDTIQALEHVTVTKALRFA